MSGGYPDDSNDKTQIEKVKKLVEGEDYCETYFIYLNVYDSSIFTEKGRNMYGEEQPSIDIYAVNDEMYKQVIREMGFEYDEVKDKGILYNSFEYVENGVNYPDQKLYNLKKGDKVSGEMNDANQTKAEIEVGGLVTQVPKELSDVNFNEGSMLVSEKWIKENAPNNLMYEMCIKTDNPDKLEEEITNLSLTGMYVTNVDATARANNALILVMEIFIYGFIIVISLIGVTNIFNTITTNMRLRSGEFAMLKSIGMTKKEFNRMIRLESLFYSTKALIIGIPIGLVGGWLILKAFQVKIMLSYSFPWQAVLISIVFVFIVVLMIMRFSIGKVNKQNIIETIRNDNI